MMSGECVEDPETFFYLGANGQLHAHIYVPDTGQTRCVLTDNCVVCGEPLNECECLRRTCPSCGSGNLTEVFNVNEVMDPSKDDVTVRCVDCTWSETL